MRQGEKWYEAGRFCERKSVNELDGESRCMLDTELSIDTQTSSCLVSVHPLQAVKPHHFPPSVPPWPCLGLLSGA